MSTKKLSEDQIASMLAADIDPFERSLVLKLKDAYACIAALEAESVADLVAAGWEIEFMLSDDGKKHEAWASRGDEHGVHIGVGDSVAAALTELRGKIGGK